MGVSQRHVSFVESGRAKPSRELLIAWLQAGYAPMYRQFALQDAPLLPANDALMHLLRSHYFEFVFFAFLSNNFM